MDKHIIPEGWNNWRNPANEATARYAEYKSSGAGAHPGKRAKWTKQLTEKDLEHFSIDKILGTWKPHLK
jgi:pectinesterase